MSRKLGREEVTTMVTELVDNESDDMWDIPTSFFLLFDRPTEERTGVMLNEDITILFMKHPEGGPARLLRTVTTALMIPFAPDMPHGLEDGDRLIGCMLRNEGWGLKSEDVGEGTAEEWVRSGKRIVDHPKAVETKMYAAYTIDVGMVIAEKERHGQVRVSEESGGAVPDAMIAFVNAFRERFPEHA